MVSVIQKYKKAHAGFKQSRKELLALSSQRSPEEIARWAMQAEEADNRRDSEGPDVMDIYETKEQQGTHRGSHMGSWNKQIPVPTRADIQLDLYEEELQSRTQNGVTSWLASGIKIQERQ